MKLIKAGFFGMAVSLSFTLVACGPAPNPVTQPSSTTPTSTPDPIPTEPPLPSGSPNQGNPNAQPTPTPSPTGNSDGSGAGTGTGNGASPEAPSASQTPAEMIATAIRLHAPSYYLNISNSYQLTAEVLNGLEKLTGVQLEWTSSKPNLIQVDSTGRATALSDSGFSVITAKIPNTDISASVTLELRSAGSGGGGGGGGSVVTPPDPGTPQPTPVITGLSPDPVDIGASLTITGTDFLASSTVTIGGVAATITSQTPTQLVVTVPTSLNSGSTNVVVSNNTLTATLAVTVNVPLVISSFAPQQGISGTQVVLTGRKFTGATAVTFNGAAATFTVDSDTQITAKVPFGAVTDGKINVVVPTENADSSTDFDVTGRVFLVRQGATGSNNGSSWTNARTSLYDTLNASQAGDEIWVAAGTYKPLTGAETSSANRNRTFQLKTGVGVYGSFAGTESTRAARVLPNQLSSKLSGDHDGAPDNYDFGILGATGMNNNAYHVVTGAAGVNDATRPVLDGFEIIAGRSNNNGAGMYNDNLSTFGPSLSNLFFNYNSASGTGGAIYNNASNLRVSKVKFEYNAAQDGGAVHDSSGSSIYNDIVFSYNVGVGGLHPNWGSVGGAVYSNNGNTSNFERVVFEGNEASSGGGNAVVGASPRFANVIYIANNGTIYGGGLFVAGNGEPQLLHATISGNSVGSNGGIIYQVAGSSPGLVMFNSLLRNNEAVVGYTLPANQGNVTFANPNTTFVRPSQPRGCNNNQWLSIYDGWRLLSTSPAIDAGVATAPAGVLLPTTDMLNATRPSGLTPDPGAYEGGFSAAGCLPPV